MTSLQSVETRFDARLVYIHSDTPNYVRVSKCIPLFRKMFREVHYIGCSRGKGWNQENALEGVHYHMADMVIPHGMTGLGRSLSFLRHVRRCLQQIQPDVVLATNEEYVLPFSTGYFPRPRFLACDLIDSLALRMMGPLRMLNPFWSVLSNIAKRTADGMVEVTEERLQRHCVTPRNVAVVFNSPEWRQVEPRAGLPRRSVYVCGSTLDKLSGVESLLAAVEQIPDLNIVFAGRMVGRWLNSHFATHPRVINLGETTPSESLRIGKACLSMYAHYKPFIPNYIYAAPNRLFDAMMLGIPLMINSECKASEFALRHGFGLATPFGDVAAMRAALEHLLQNTEAIHASCREAQQIFRERFAWQYMERSWEEFFTSMGIPQVQSAPSEQVQLGSAP